LRAIEAVGQASPGRLGANSCDRAGRSVNV
jgi:hypothetical protein